MQQSGSDCDLRTAPDRLASIGLETLRAGCGALNRSMERDFEPVATELQTRLAAMFAGIARKRVIVAFSTTGAVHYAGVSSDAECGADPAEWIFPTGCITKLFTGALIGHTFDARGIGIDAPVTRCSAA
jgi:CubicO group peptidase (beta-lactamase class C family)